MRPSRATRWPRRIPGMCWWNSSTQAASGIGDTLEALLDRPSRRAIVATPAIAASLDQRADLWRLREALSEAQNFEGGSIKHDISVPVGRVPDFLARGRRGRAGA